MTHVLGLLVRAGALLALCLAAGCAFKNNPPDTPAVPTGPTQVLADSPATYVYSATDPDGDSVYLGLDSDFGGYEYVDWSRLFASGDTASTEFGWGDSGTYRLRVRALDVHGYYSDWSPWLTIRVERPAGGMTDGPRQGPDKRKESQ